MLIQLLLIGQLLPTPQGYYGFGPVHPQPNVGAISVLPLAEPTDAGPIPDTGWDASGYDATGYDATGYDATGYDATGYDATGDDASGYDASIWPDATPPDSGIDDAGNLAFVTTGQSWANNSANHIPVISAAQAFSNLWVTSSGLVPLVNDSARLNEEVIDVPIVNNLRAIFEMHYPDTGTPPFKSIWRAQGGARLDQIDCRDNLDLFSPTTVCQGILDDAAVAVSNGVTQIPIVFYLQGHADIGDQTDPVVWCDRLEVFRQDLQTQFRAISGYNDNGVALKLLMMGEGRFVRNALGFSTTPFTDGQAACAELYPNIYLGPGQMGHIPFNNIDNLHNTGQGQIMMAGGMAQAGYELVFGSGAFESFMMENCNLDNPTQVTCNFHIPCREYGGSYAGDPAGCRNDPPIVIDPTPGQHQWPNSGFRIRGDNLGAVITNVTIPACDAGVTCPVVLTLDKTPETGSIIGIADEGDAGAYPSRTYAGSNLRTSRTSWPTAVFNGNAGGLDDAGMPFGDDFPSPRSKVIAGIDAGYYADAAASDSGIFPDATVIPYDDCYAVRFGGFADGTNTGSLIEIGGGWNQPAGPALAGLNQWTIMMHFTHNALVSGIRNVPFVQWDDGVVGVGAGQQYLILTRLEPVFSNDFYAYITSGAGGTPYRYFDMTTYPREVQVVLVYDGTQATATNRLRAYRWLNGATNGLQNVGTYGAFGTPTLPTVMGNSDKPFTIGGGYSPSLWDLDGDMYSFAAWETALSASQVAELNSGTGPIDPRNASVIPDIYFSVDSERPGATILTDEITGVSGTLTPSYTYDGGINSPIDGSIPQVVATGRCP